MRNDARANRLAADPRAIRHDARVGDPNGGTHLQRDVKGGPSGNVHVRTDRNPLSSGTMIGLATWTELADVLVGYPITLLSSRWPDVDRARLPPV